MKKEKTELLKIKEVLKELKDAQYVGEDGGMVVICPTRLGALRKFRKLMRQDVGDYEASELSIDEIGIVYIEVGHFWNNDGDECDWCSQGDPKKGYKAWSYYM